MYHTSHQTHSNHMLIQLPPRWNCMPDHLIKLINDHVKLMVLIIWSNSQGIDQLRSSCIDHPRRKSLWLRTFFSCFRNFDTMSAGWSRTDKSLGINHFLFLIFDLWFVHLYNSSGEMYSPLKSRDIIIIWELTCLGPENLPGVFPRPPHPLTSGWSADRSPLNIRLWQ